MKQKIRLPKELAEKWIAALRSGEYDQTQKKLYDGDEYCCLGVLGCILGTPKGKMYKYSSLQIGNEIQGLPSDINHNSDLEFESDEYAKAMNNVDIFVKMNDVENKSFIEIADYIQNECELY